jgi:hypothetical protein
MNNIAISPYIGMHALQIQNVKRNVVKKASIKELNNEIVHPLEKQPFEQPPFEQPPLEQIEEKYNEIGTNINNLPEPLQTDNNIGSEI